MSHRGLLYHDVVVGPPGESGFPGADADAYKLAAADFEAHLDRIVLECPGQAGVLQPDGAVAGGGSAPVLLTFDDGGVSALEPTASLLEARGLRGHFFVVTSRIGQPGFLDAEGIRSLVRRGHHVGSHSHTHPEDFSRLDAAAMLHEWAESRRILAAVTGQAPTSASVPGGFYTRAVARAAAQAGYRVLFNSEPSGRARRVEGLTVMGRYGVQRATSAAAAAALARGALGPVLRQALAWNAKKPLKRLGGQAWLRFRRWVFARSARSVALAPPG